jgi:hypothetical protein
MADPVRAKDVTVRKIWRAECHRPECTAVAQGFRDRASWADAAADRHAHLNWHALNQPDDTTGQEATMPP